MDDLRLNSIINFEHMKKLIAFLLLNTGLLSAQPYQSLPFKNFGQPNLALILKKNRYSAFPSYFEETDSLASYENENEKVSILYYSIYNNRENRIPGGFRKITDKMGIISMVKNDTLTTRFNRNADSSAGIIAGKSGTVFKTLISKASDRLPATEKYTLKEDSTHYLIYKPEFNLIELETGSLYERRILLGELYSSVLKGLDNKEAIAPVNLNLKPGDEMQILFYTRKLDLDKKEFRYEPVNAMNIKVLKGDVPEELYFESTTIDLLSSTTSNRYKGAFLNSEGYAITDGQVFIKDGIYSEGLKIFPVNTEIRPHPLMPVIDLSGPQIEAFWKSDEALESFNQLCYSYWNSSVNSRIVFLPQFPIPWRDAGDGYIGKPVYVKTEKLSVGKPLKIDKNKALHFEEVEIKGDTIYLHIFSPSKTDIYIHYEYSGEKLSIKKNHRIPKGSSKLALSLNEFAASYSGFLVLSELKGKEIIEKQRFKLTLSN
jgi:hypothetical protein